MQSPGHDLALAFIWVPFAVAAHAVASDAERLRWLVSATLLFSFAHQPLTLWLAYADAGQRRTHRTFFAWAPLVAIVTVSIGASMQPEVVALVAGIWNVVHSMRQRYGVSRLYGRLRNIDCASDHRLLWSWLLVAIAVALLSIDLGVKAREVGLGSRDRIAVEALASTRPIALVVLPIAVAIAYVLTARGVRAEWQRTTRSWPRLAYLGSTAMLLILLAVAPVTGFVAFVGAHAAEYILMVRWRIGQAAHRASAGDRVGALTRRIGRDGSIALYATAVVALIVAMRAVERTQLAVIGILTLGTLHFVYDAVIWRSPRGPVPTHHPPQFPRPRSERRS